MVTGFTDHQAANRAGIDQGARQSGYPLFPAGCWAMDVERHTVACSENWHSCVESWGHKRITCGDCNTTLRSDTWRDLKAQMAEHLR